MIPREISQEQRDYLEELIANRDKYHDIKVLADTKGGKELKQLLATEIVGLLRRLAESDYGPLCSHLKANLDLLNLLNNAGINQEVVDEQLKDTLLQ